VTDRKKWKGIVRQAKAHSGLWHQWKKKKLQILQWCPKNSSICVLCAVSELDVLRNVMHVPYLMLSIEG
jgi:hypothetical protein